MRRSPLPPSAIHQRGLAAAHDAQREQQAEPPQRLHDGIHPDKFDWLS